MFVLLIHVFLGEPPQQRVQHAGLLLRLCGLAALRSLHAPRVGEKPITISTGPDAELAIGYSEIKRMRNGGVPITEADRQPLLGAAHLQNIEIRIPGMVWIVVETRELLCVFLRFLVAAFFRAIGDEIADVVRVVPVVRWAHVLALHVVAVDAHGIQEDLARPLVVANTIEDVSGHMHHMSGGWCKRSKPLGRCNRPLWVAGFDGVDPIMVRGSIVGMLRK